MKLLLEKSKLSAGMLDKIIRDYVGADALVRPAEQSSAEANDHQPTTNDWTSAIGQSLAQLLKRPEITIERLLPVLRELTPEFFARRNP